MKALKKAMETLKKFKAKNKKEKTAIIIDIVFSCLVVYFSVAFLMLLWAGAGLTLLWLLEHHPNAMQIVPSLMWIWFITPPLWIAYYYYKKMKKMIKK